MAGTFILSLDFELHWGRFDRIQLDENGRRYFLRTRELIPEVLKRFQRAGVHCTWATVGLLFAENRRQQLEYFPAQIPQYQQSKFNAYALFKRGEVGQDEHSDPFHFAPSLIRKILETPGQELASHTFSHYYCLEAGQTIGQFSEDLQAAQAIAKANAGLHLRSLVFPRNQFPLAYLSAVNEAGFQAIRDNPAVWFWQEASRDEENLLKRAFRFADHYVPLHADTTCILSPIHKDITAVSASRFLRPFEPAWDGVIGQSLKIKRILNEMSHAAARDRHYHLWWHPHNLATNPRKNLAALDQILQHFQQLRDRYGMKSKSMLEVAQG